jgi:hypothetical protein
MKLLQEEEKPYRSGKGGEDNLQLKSARGPDGRNQILSMDFSS